MQANTYAILRRAIEEGVAYGVNRAFKHTDEPERETIMHEVEEAVMGAICQVFTFQEDE